MLYKRCGRSGLLLPEVSLGLWHNFGSEDSFSNARQILLHAFDCGITHFDLANNYGPEPGSAEINFGRVLNSDLATHRDEMVISTKAGYKMWEGPYGDWGSRKHMLASLDQSLKRMNIDYVDIFYSHRFDPETPLEETMSALITAVNSGRAIYAGISRYPVPQAVKAYEILRSAGVPCLIHQERFNMFDRHAEQHVGSPETPTLIDTVSESGVGLITFSPLAQGLLSDRYLNGIPDGSRMTQGRFLKPEALTPARHAAMVSLNKMAAERGQSLAAMALQWNLQRPAITSVLIGASSVEQLDRNLLALDGPAFSSEQLAEIDRILAPVEPM
jgi:L-glyceraldehyde 3-phosphate reductase